MSVKERKWKDEEGRMQTAWVVDVKMLVPGQGIVRVRRTSPINNKRGAEAFERQVRVALLNGTFNKEEDERKAQTFDDFLPTYLAYCVNNNKFSTLDSKRRVIAHHLKPFFGAKRLDAIGPADIEQFKSEMSQKLSRARQPRPDASKWAKLKRYGAEPPKLSRKTINNALTCLRKMLVVAEEQGVVNHVPRVRLFRSEPTEFDFLSFEEADLLLAAADDHLRPALLLVLKTGLRIGELLALQWSDLDLGLGRVVVRRNFYRGHLNPLPKGGKAKMVDLAPSVIEALKTHRHLRSPWVFCRDDGTPLTEARLNRMLNAAVKQSGIVREKGRIGWHDLRHTFASHLAMRGVPLVVNSQLLRHSDIKTTMRYSHLSPEMTREAVQKLDEPSPLAMVAEGHMRGTRKIVPQ